MLEDYLAFAKGDGGEEAKPTNLAELLEEIVDDASIYASTIDLKIRKSKGDIVLPLKRQALKRAITNLVTNAARFGDHIIIRVAPEGQWVRIEVDDDGPGIPERERDNVFRPFYRLDHARNQDEGNSGLGLGDRPRHREEPRRRDRPRRKLDGRPPRHYLIAAIDFFF